MTECVQHKWWSADGHEFTCVTCGACGHWRTTLQVGAGRKSSIPPAFVQIHACAYKGCPNAAVAKERRRWLCREHRTEASIFKKCEFGGQHTAADCKCDPHEEQ